jgi:2'-hydroxyisoflavone reductase
VTKSQGYAYQPKDIGKAAKPLKILILGGTGFTGPYQVKYALARGHTVTVFNRGKSHPGELPSGVEQLIGDRNGQLDALKNRKWDVVIDNPTMLPKWVHDAAEILKGNVERYIFISTISVYAGGMKAGADESAPVVKYDGKDAMKETRDTVIASKFALYGSLKALSEKEVEKWFSEKSLIIRPGLIVGPGDESDRFTYWPVRIERGGEVLAPGHQRDPVQFIDARDLAEWTIRMAEARAFGVYNATGPDYEMSTAAMLYGIRAVTTAGATINWIPTAFLDEQKVQAWSDMPVWVPGQGESAGFARISVRKALAAGLTFRPLATTAADTLAWFNQQPAERQAKLHAGLAPEREAELLAAWKAQQGT